MSADRPLTFFRPHGWWCLVVILTAGGGACPSRDQTQPRALTDKPRARSSAGTSGAPRGVTVGPGFKLAPLFDLGHRDVKTFAYAQPKGELFVSFSDRSDKVLNREGDRLYQWDVAQAKRLHIYRLDRKWLVDELFLSPTGKHLVVRMYLPDNGASHWAKYILLDTARRTMTSGDLKIYNERHVEVAWSKGGSQFRIKSDTTRQWTFDLRGKPTPLYTAVFPPPPKSRLAVIPSSKRTIRTHGLYYEDDAGTQHRVTNNHWHHNFALTKDGRFVVTTTWDGELLLWSTRLRLPVHRHKIAAQYGHLAYDPQRNRFLIGDATHNGTTYLRALTLRRTH